MTFPRTRSKLLPEQVSSHTADRAATADRGCDTSASGQHFYDAAEALTNATVGLVVSWLATLFVLGFPPLQSAAITGMFFALSTTRAWLLRRVFRGLQNG